jgi:hypothetical protein
MEAILERAPIIHDLCIYLSLARVTYQFVFLFTKHLLAHMNQTHCIVIVFSGVVVVDSQASHQRATSLTSDC